MPTAEKYLSNDFDYAYPRRTVALDGEAWDNPSLVARDMRTELGNMPDFQLSECEQMALYSIDRKNSPGASVSTIQSYGFELRVVQSEMRLRHMKIHEKFFRFFDTPIVYLQDTQASLGSKTPVATASNSFVLPGMDTVAPVALAVPRTLLKPFWLEDGTTVRLVLSQNLSLGDAFTGQIVEFAVVDDVLVNDLLVIKHGSIASAMVTDAKLKKCMGRSGKLDLNIHNVRLADGDQVLLRAFKDGKGPGHPGATIATSLLVWPAAPFYLLIHARESMIPKGTNISAFVHGNVTLDGARFKSNPELTISPGRAV